MYETKWKPVEGCNFSTALYIFTKVILICWFYLQDVYRAAIVEEWLNCFKELGLPHTEETNLISSLGDPITINLWKVRSWPWLDSLWSNRFRFLLLFFYFKPIFQFPLHLRSNLLLQAYISKWSEFWIFWMYCHKFLLHVHRLQDCPVIRHQWKTA